MNGNQQTIDSFQLHFFGTHFDQLEELSEIQAQEALHITLDLWVKLEP